MDTSPVRDTPSPVEMPELQVQRIIDRLRDVYRKNLAKSAAARAALAEYGFTDQSLIERYMGGFSDGTLPKLLPADKSLRGQLTQLGVLDDRAQERFANCVVFPVDSADGRRVTLWACPKEGPPRFLLTRPVPLWNAIAAKHSAHLYVFDGPITALSAAAAGLSNIAALDPDAGEPDHKAITGWGVQGISVIVPATPEGLKKGKQIQARLEPLKSTLVSIPGCDSLNALFRTQGPKGDPNTSGQDSGQNGATPVTWNYDQLPVDNSGAAQYQSLNVQGVNTAAGVTVDELRHAFLPKSPEVFVHDADGNLTDDARWHYTWDGENRLSEMQTSAAAFAAGVPKKRLVFTYDALGRRVAKRVMGWDATANAWGVQASILFLYDGWNLVAELNSLSPLTLTRSYAWGLDLSGSSQGAGGVGGLLFAAVSAPNSSLQAPCYDGNGNAIGYVDLATGALSATYEYSPFGETLIAEGYGGDMIPFRFSTKYADAESGLLYYGLRYYSPIVGRWLAKDPSEERGGPNLYSMLSNQPNNFIDLLGLWETPIHHAIADKFVAKHFGQSIEFGCCGTLDLASLLKQGSDIADGVHSDGSPDLSLDIFDGIPFVNAQSSARSNEHGLARPDQEAGGDDARNGYEDSIRKNVREATRRFVAAERRAALSRIRCADAQEAFVYIGRAMHAVGDSYSPSHKGFQPWYGPIDGLRTNDYLNGPTMQVRGAGPVGHMLAYGLFLYNHHVNEPNSRYIDYSDVQDQIDDDLDRRFTGILQRMIDNPPCCTRSQ